MPKTSKYKCEYGGVFTKKGNLVKHKQAACSLKTVKIRFPCECGRFLHKKSSLVKHKKKTCSNRPPMDTSKI